MDKDVPCAQLNPGKCERCAFLLSSATNEVWSGLTGARPIRAWQSQPLTVEAEKPPRRNLVLTTLNIFCAQCSLHLRRLLHIHDQTCGESKRSGTLST